MIERSFAFGPGNALVGTVCLPRTSARLGIIALNAGVVHRVGPHRANVRLARRLARRGIASLRFDLSGQGDSGRIPGGGYLERAVEDIRLAIGALSAEAGVTRVGLFGICSGGVHSFAAAQLDSRVAGAILYDTYIFPTARSRFNRNRLKLHNKPMTTIAADVLRKTAEAFGLRAAPAGAGSVTGRFVTPSAEDFAKTVLELHARGTRIGMMYSGAFEQYNYAGQFADRFRALGLERIVTCDYFPEMGHTATLMEHQARLLGRVESWFVDLDRSLAEREPAAAVG